MNTHCETWNELFCHYWNLFLILIHFCVETTFSFYRRFHNSIISLYPAFHACLHHSRFTVQTINFNCWNLYYFADPRAACDVFFVVLRGCSRMTTSIYVIGKMVDTQLYDFKGWNEIIDGRKERDPNSFSRINSGCAPDWQTSCLAPSFPLVKIR